MHKDGEEQKLEAQIVFAYVAPDPQVGINGGWVPAGIEIGDEFIEFEEVYMHTQQVTRLALDKSGVHLLQKIACDLEDTDDGVDEWPVAGTEGE